MASRPALPTVIGNEGVGRVLAVGPGVENVKVGDRVLAPLSSFTWREQMVVSANGLFALPPDADPQQLSMLAINPPTAALLLSEYVNLKPGEWVVQNSANSGVGRWVIAFAKTRGLKTVNIVRRPELVAELKAIGGDVVVVDSPDVSKEIKEAVGQAELRLALDGVSGPATGVLASTLSPHGTLVSYAAMSLGPMSISPLEVIFKPLTVRGFWLGHPESAAKMCASGSAGGRDDRVRPGAHSSGGNLRPLVHQGSRRACATRRKGSSERSRIIQLTPEWHLSCPPAARFQHLYDGARRLPPAIHSPIRRVCLPKTLSGMTRGWAYGNEAADGRVSDPAAACYPVAVHTSSAA